MMVSLPRSSNPVVSFADKQRFQNRADAGQNVFNALVNQDPKAKAALAKWNIQSHSGENPQQLEIDRQAFMNALSQPEKSIYQDLQVRQQQANLVNKADTQISTHSSHDKGYGQDIKNDVQTLKDQQGNISLQSASHALGFTLTSKTAANLNGTDGKISAAKLAEVLAFEDASTTGAADGKITAAETAATKAIFEQAAQAGRSAISANQDTFTQIGKAIGVE